MKVNILRSSCPHNPYIRRGCDFSFIPIPCLNYKKNHKENESKINRQKAPGDDSQTVLDDYCHNSECEGHKRADADF